jgi:hypothetical protein
MIFTVEIVLSRFAARIQSYANSIKEMAAPGLES